jgi:hypothetical protein
LLAGKAREARGVAKAVFGRFGVLAKPGGASSFGECGEMIVADFFLLVLLDAADCVTLFCLARPPPIVTVAAG